MLRGEIWWAALPTPASSEPGYRRPILIIQSDSFNRSRIATIIGAAITSNLQLAEAPGNIRLTKRDSGLPKRSVVNVSQMLTVDKSFLIEKAGQLSAVKMQEIEEGIRLVLSV